MNYPTFNAFVTNIMIYFHSTSNWKPKGRLLKAPEYGHDYFARNTETLSSAHSFSGTGFHKQKLQRMVRLSSEADHC